VPSIFYNFEIIDALYHDASNYSAQIFIFLIIGLLNFSITYIFGTLLTANGNLKQLNVIAGSSLALNVSLNLLLIPRMQATGAAIASMITQISVVILQVLVCTKNFGLKRNIRFLIQLLVYISISTILFWLIKNHLDLKWFYNWSIMIVAGLIMALAGKIIHIKNLIWILRYDSR